LHEHGATTFSSNIQVEERGSIACWTELINTEETRNRRLPELKIARGRRLIFGELDER
jgi:hypothetical protein